MLSRLRQHQTATGRVDDRAEPVTYPRRLNVRGTTTGDAMRHKEALRQAHTGEHFVARMIEILARGKWLPRVRRYEAAMPTEIPRHSRRCARPRGRCRQMLGGQSQHLQRPSPHAAHQRLVNQYPAIARRLAAPSQSVTPASSSSTHPPPSPTPGAPMSTPLEVRVQLLDPVKDAIGRLLALVARRL